MRAGQGWAEGRCRAEFCPLPDYASPSVGRFRVRCGGGVRIRGGVGIRQSGSDFNEGMHNLAGVQISAQHRMWPRGRTMPRSGVEWTSVARVAAVAQVAVGYFENTVAGKITEPWVAVFRATFIIYRGRPKCI